MQLRFSAFAFLAQSKQYFVLHEGQVYISEAKGPLWKRQKDLFIWTEGGIAGGGGIFFSLILIHPKNI